MRLPVRPRRSFFIRTLATAGALVLAAGTAQHAAAQAAGHYPDKPVRLVVGFPPGSAADVAARRVAQQLTITLGQSFFIENRPGASGGIAAEYVAKSPADGYTLWVGTTSEVAINKPGGMKVRYDMDKDFVPTALLFVTAPVVVASNASGFKTAQDMVAAAKAKPGTVSIAAVNAFQQMVVASFEKAANVKLNMVYYKGTALALNDVMGNQIDSMVGYPAESMPSVEAGKSRALAIVGKQRNPFMAQTPTMAESGVPVPDLVVWGGIFAPAGTPPAVVELLNKQFVAASQVPEVKAAAAKTGAEVHPWSQPEFKSFVDAEMRKWEQVVRDTGVHLE